MTGIIKLLTNVLSPSAAAQTLTVKRAGTNPFAAASGNPFVSAHNSNPFEFYGQNRPVSGGYFAGYYNNQPNIVGRRLFIEV